MIFFKKKLILELLFENIINQTFKMYLKIFIFKVFLIEIVYLDNHLALFFKNYKKKLNFIKYLNILQKSFLW